MLGKKRNKEEEGLHDDETLLEYQNRCLINKVKEQNDEIKSLKSQVELLRNQGNCLSKIFMEVNCKLLSMVDSLDILMCEMEIDPERTGMKKTSVVVGLEILKNLKGGFSNKENLTEQHASILENIKNNIDSIVTKVVGGCANTSTIDSTEKENNLTIKFQNLSIELNKKTLELSNLEQDKFDYYSTLKEKENEILELQSKISCINRKNICNPLIPYIKYSKEIFETIKPEHNCVCHVCGEDFLKLTEENDNRITNYQNSLLQQQINQNPINQFQQWSGGHSISYSGGNLNTLNSGYNSFSSELNKLNHQQVILSRGNSTLDNEALKVSSIVFYLFSYFLY